MKLYGFVNRVVNGKSYFSFSSYIPTPLVKKLGWEHGDELEAEISGDSLVITKKKNSRVCFTAIHQ